MSGESVRFEEIFLVFALTSAIAASAVLVAVLAFRKSHGLIDFSERVARRFDLLNRYAGSHQDMARVNLLALSAFLLWLSFMVCLAGIRLAIA